MERTTRWIAGTLLALTASGCAQLEGAGGVERRLVVDGVPVRDTSVGRAPSRVATMRGKASATGKSTRSDSPVVADDGGAGDIAGDFLHALVQIAGYSPEETSVSFSRDAIEGDAIVAALEPMMRERGYAVRVIAGGSGDVAHVASEDAAAGATVHTVSIGGVQMRRSYRESDGSWMPAGSLFVRGADASGIRMDDARTDVRRPEPKAAPNRKELVAEATARPSAVPRRATPPATPLAIDESSGKVAWSGLAAKRADASPMPRALPGNRFGLDDSNFADAFEAYGDVDELILTFPNDSLVLGARNKARIRQTLERFDPARDSFAIVGCSLGKTNVAHGNEALALGRANRVKEELLFAGVPRERIFEEGCWAGEATAKFPSRGVVLTHKRRKDV